jgi:hypothetical protein
MQTWKLLLEEAFRRFPTCFGGTRFTQTNVKFGEIVLRL